MTAVQKNGTTTLDARPPSPCLEGLNVQSMRVARQMGVDGCEWTPESPTGG